MRALDVRRLHRVTYENGMAMQERLVALRQKEAIADQLLLLEHTPVITLGRGGDPANLLAPAEIIAREGVRFFETTRGGDITYHGPGQLVGYPILHLGEGRRDVRKYVTAIEEVIIRTLADYGIDAHRAGGNRGVWTGNQKIAAIGVRIARWVTSHGFALNLTTDLRHFDFITPCGLPGTGVTSMEKLLGSAPPLEEVQDRLIGHFATVFERQPLDREHELQLVKVLVHNGSRVLLLRRTPGRGAFWQPVTGRIEAGESAAAAARRELFEETAVTGSPVPLPLRQSFLIDSSFVGAADTDLFFADETAFQARVPTENAIRPNPEEHDEARWFTFREACETIRWSDDREALEQLERLLRETAPATTSNHHDE